MNKMIYSMIIVFVFLLTTGCDKSNPIGEENHSIFETIEHAAIHMQDATGIAIAADTAKPGPHLDPDSIDHRRIDVTLPVMGSGYGGYIHFGPDATGDRLVCFDIEAMLDVTNRTGSGDSPIAIEETFTAQQIADSAKTTLIKSAYLFEAKTGGNILKIGPVSQSTIRVIIEEVEHGHDH